MRRRSLLVAVAAGIAGCSGREGGSRSNETVTPVAVPESTPLQRGSVSVSASRFDRETPCPDDVTCFHRIDPANPPDVVVSPSRELYTPAEPAGELTIRNEFDEELSVSVSWHLRKYSGHRWIRILSPTVRRNGVVRLPPGDSWRREHTVENVMGLPVLGEGLYARVEVAWYGSRQAERGFPSAVAFEVEDSTLELRPVREAIVDGDVAEVVYTQAADKELLFRRVGGADDAVELVPEAVGSIPVFRDAIPRLDAASEVRVRTSLGELAFEYLEAAAVRESTIAPGDPVSVLGRTFSVHTEGANR